jgi:hypothetical protein
MVNMVIFFSKMHRGFSFSDGMGQTCKGMGTYILVVRNFKD